MRRFQIAALVTLSFLAACRGGIPDSEPGPSAPTTDAIGTAVRTALGSDAEARYFPAEADLNSDGESEIVAYAAGPAVGGTGGCHCSSSLRKRLV